MAVGLSLFVFFDAGLFLGHDAEAVGLIPAVLTLSDEGLKYLDDVFLIDLRRMPFVFIELIQVLRDLHHSIIFLLLALVVFFGAKLLFGPLIVFFLLLIGGFAVEGNKCGLLSGDALLFLLGESVALFRPELVEDLNQQLDVLH